MKNIYIATCVILFCTLFLSCTTDRTYSQDQEQKIGTDYHLDIVADGIARKGYKLARTECAECHRFYSPEEYSPEQWDRIIKEKAKRLSLMKDQVDALDLFFQSRSRK